MPAQQGRWRAQTQLPTGHQQSTSQAAVTAAALPPAQHSNAMGLVVLSEDDEPRTLLIHRISKDDIYQRQGARAAADSAQPSARARC